MEWSGTFWAGTCRLGVLMQSDTLTDANQPAGTGLFCLPITQGPLVSASAAVGFISEDEYLEITGITREQSGEYECSASNDVSAPVVQRVKVTVNCESLGASRGQGWGWAGSPR